MVSTGDVDFLFHIERMHNTNFSSHSPEDNKPQEACGITAIFSKSGKHVSIKIPILQNLLQHRGRDAAGIAVFDEKNKKIRVYKNLGRVKEVFPNSFNFAKYKLQSSSAIGHNRYGTSGDSKKDSMEGAQPVIASWKGRTVAIAYNGNLPESERQKLRKKIPKDMLDGHNFDTWDIAQAIVSADGDSWEERIRNGLDGVLLAYALTILTDKGEVFGLVCPSETWPLWVGEDKDKIIFASETRVAKNKNIYWRKIERGELVKATKQGIVRTQLFVKQRLFRCALHDQYGARGESHMTEKITYREFRKYLGSLLAREFPLDVDLYAGVPKSGLPAAEGYVEALSKKLTTIITLITDTRGFIARNDSEINAVINGKYAILHPKKLVGKKVLLIDDSLIRGKTAGGDTLRGVKGVVALVKDAGAKEVHFAVTLPKFTKDCDMGYYIRKESLIALTKQDDGTYNEMLKDDIARKIGATSLHFLSIEKVKDAYEWILGKREIICTHCMGSKHPLLIMQKRNGVLKKKQQPVVFPSMQLTIS